MASAKNVYIICERGAGKQCTGETHQVIMKLSRPGETNKGDQKRRLKAQGQEELS